MKFKLGQRVKVRQDGETGEVLAISVNAEGIRYQISSREVDLQKKELVNGVKTLMEDELTAVKEGNEK